MLTELLPGAAQLAVFATAVLVLNATPGVDFLLTVSRTLQGGARAGVAAALGIVAGGGVHALAAAFGLAALLAVHPAAFGFVQWAGAGYLVWLGLGLFRQAWRGRADVAAPPTAAAVRAWAADFRTGLFTNVLNPKVALFFLAFLPPFVPAGSPSRSLSFLLLGAWCVLQGALFLLALVAVTAQLQRWGRGMAGHGRWTRLLQGLGGMLFVALAWRMLKERPVGT